MGDLVRSKDWSQTPLGPLDSWPQSLRTTVNLALASNFPIAIAWGPHRVQIYNDGYWPICGEKHPQSLGQDFRECWFSAWPAIGEAFDSASAGHTAFLENQRMFLDRYGYLEETFFTFSFSPIRDETGEVVGLFHPVTELTTQTLAERRLQILRELGDAAANTQTLAEAAHASIDTIRRHQLDVPFALLYLSPPGSDVAQLAAAAHLDPGSALAPAEVWLGGADGAPWPLGSALQSGQPVLLEDLAVRMPPLGCGPYPESPQSAILLPLTLPALAHPLGILVAGVSPRRELDPTYRTFFTMLQDAVVNALINARSIEVETKRAEELAELDRAKTTFFSNVSHEFRTPLTLMLGPLEDALAAEPGASSEQRERLQVAHRNALRLLKLVNTLLDFSRIEADRVQANFEPTDLASLTAELASNFRSACEKAGLELQVACAPTPEPIHVDRDMWEKVVLNLLSNAFKFTFAGRIAVTLETTASHAVLRVADTGEGIPGDAVPRLFERFHRVEQTRSRTHEGTGIGLALVRELVRLHGGTIEATSEVGRGTTFTVAIPRGTAQLPPDRIRGGRSLASTAIGASPFVEEALRWLPDAPAPQDRMLPRPPLEAAPPAGAATAPAGRVLLVDDNADMREYTRRLLSPRFQVELAADGATALTAALQAPPDLVLTDVMMPGLDGFGLLRALRADPRTRSIPVILLSARAGEASRVEGLDAGADDYLIKPFSARELVARVETHLKLAQTRRQTELALRQADRRKDEFLATLGHELRNPLGALSNALTLLDIAHAQQGRMEYPQEVMRRQVAQLTRLIDDLLDVHRITRGTLQLRRRPLDLVPILHQAVENYRGECPDRRFEILLPQDPVRIDGDPARMLQVFGNLISNACKFTTAGGRIRVEVAVTDAEVEVTIADDGIGIPADALATVFEMFAQVEAPAEQVRSGLGIGLTLVRQLVTQHGGSVTAHSNGVGRGSTFVARLPLLRRAPGSGEPDLAGPAAAARSIADMGSGRRILVVDDNEDAARSLGLLLELAGNEVHLAHDGERAVEAACDLEPDVVLLDLGLPKLDGYEAARRIRARTAGRDLVLIALTGWGQPSDRERSRAAGIDQHLVKPVDPGRLLEILQDPSASTRS